MKKLMLAFVASAAFVSVVSADDWFVGTVGRESGGSWNGPTSGVVTTNETTLVLDDASGLSFEAQTPKSLSASENLNFATKVNFKYSYDDLPEVEADAKAGVVVHDGKYYVLAKGVSDSNVWTDSGVAVTTVDEDVDVKVTISNGTSAVYAIYTFGTGEPVVMEVKAAETGWGTVDYSGSGKIASLVGTTTSLEAGYPIPGDKVISKSVGDAWALAQGIPSEKIAEVLASDQLYAGNRTAAESCLLGVATNAEIRAVVEDKTADKLDFTVQCTPVAGRVVFQLKKDGVSAGDPDTLQIDIADGVYTVVAYVDGANKEIPASQAIGVKGTAVASGEVSYIGAPWTDCSIADLFKKTCCTENDKVEVYDAASDSYKTWKFQSGTWVYVDAVDEPSVRKGQAVKYTAAAGKTVYAVGDVSTATATAIVKGADKWNLVAAPAGSVAVTALPLDGAKARVVQLGPNGVTPTKIVLKINGQVYKRSSYNGVSTQVGAEETLVGGFFLKTENAEEVTW